MQAFYSWAGPGRGYDRPDGADKRITANQYGRQNPNPGVATFRFRQTSKSIFAQGGQNQSGTTHDNIKTADELSRDENFKF